MMTAYLAALLMGLTGSLHCAGMCGPIMLFMPFHHFKGAKKVAGVLLYHVSRVAVYAGMAVVLFSFRDLFAPRVQQVISITLGSILLVAGILSFIPGNKRLHLNLPWSQFVTKRLGQFISSPGLSSIALSGMLNGLLPCGLVYMALSASLAMHTAAQAALFTSVFGLGTMPVLFSIVIFRSRLMTGRGTMLRRLTPVIVFSFGCLFLLRGMNLGIPYLSPKVQMSNGQVHACCCHKSKI